MARILYLSCHEILQWDESNILIELGHNVFCPGAHVSKENTGDLNLRPGLPKCDNHDILMEEWHKLGKPGKDNKECITLDFLKNFDCVILMHLPQWMHANWAVFKESGLKIIWRTVGQSVARNEKEMAKYRSQGMSIVRYSPRERRIPGYIGEDAMIRFYKDPSEFCDWNGGVAQVITFGQHMQEREPSTNYKLFESLTSVFPRTLFGPGSEALDFGGGKLAFSDMKKEMRDNRVYLYTGTWPASYTLNFIEAMMTGMPMVCIGPAKGNPHSWFPGHDLYEIPDIIKNGVNGFFSDSATELQSYIKEMLDNKDLANSISAAGRATAIGLFGKDSVKQLWKSYFESQ